MEPRRFSALRAWSLYEQSFIACFAIFSAKVNSGYSIYTSPTFEAFMLKDVRSVHVFPAFILRLIRMARRFTSCHGRGIGRSANDFTLGVLTDGFSTSE